MADPSLEQIRQRIAGPEPLLLIEAPAGYGKTQEAVVAASTMSATLPPGCYVLFLTHTNAARHTFNQRMRGGAAVMKTIHALADEIVDLYAAPLELPRPLQPFRGQPSFDAMITNAISILERRPEVARGLALRYPVLLVDEYQDCVVDQARLVELIAAAAPTRLRLFGDDLQAIYEFAGDPVDFAALTARHPTVQLTTPWRWSNQPDMRQFVVDARHALLTGAPIELRHVPTCVTVTVWEGSVPSPHQEGHVPACLSALRTRLGGATAVLTHHNTHALGLRRKLPGHGSYHEGSDHQPAQTMLEHVVAAAGDPQALVALLVRAMEKWGVGMTKPYRDQIKQICTPNGVEVGNKKRILTFAQLCNDLYAAPTVNRWLDCLRRVADGGHVIAGWKVLRGDQLYLLTNLWPSSDDDPTALLQGASHARSARRGSPTKGFMVIHKAKGLQFDEVALPYCCGALFTDDLPSRRRLYVAISRAQRRLHFLVPKDDPTPLLRL
jgi:DNA helicase-2/ATP-dependent DNA helicase PcrA